MARTTPNQLHAAAERASRALFGADRPSEIHCQRSATGWHVYRQFGAGWQALAECLTPGECRAMLRGLETGAELRP